MKHTIEFTTPVPYTLLTAFHPLFTPIRAEHTDIQRTLEQHAPIMVCPVPEKSACNLSRDV